MKKIHQETILELVEKNDGRVTANDIVAIAQDPASPLHDAFEWDDTAAAKKYRISQARQLLKQVSVIIETTEFRIKVPALLRDPDKEHREQGYMSTVMLKSDADRKREALVNEFARAASALDRAKRLAQYFDLEDGTERAVGAVRKLREDAESLMLNS